MMIIVSKFTALPRSPLFWAPLQAVACVARHFDIKKIRLIGCYLTNIWEVSMSTRFSFRKKNTTPKKLLDSLIAYHTEIVIQTRELLPIQLFFLVARFEAAARGTGHFSNLKFWARLAMKNLTLILVLIICRALTVWKVCVLAKK